LDKLLEMTEKYPVTHYWNDSCSLSEIKYAIDRGAVGATTNPVIVKQVLEKEMDSHRDYITDLLKNNPNESEDEIAWRVIEKMAAEGAALLEPLFDPSKSTGRISIQTNTKNYNNSARLTAQAVHFAAMAPNIQVKIPVTSEGIKAIEEATYRGVSINATVSFSVPQAVAVAEAVERALNRRIIAGLSNDSISPICTIMIGRLDDWLKYVAKRDNIPVSPASTPATKSCPDLTILDFAGISCMKKAYRIYRERGYRTRLLAAAYRHIGHWTSFIGGEISMTIPYVNQVAFNAADIEITDHMEEELHPAGIAALRKFPDFVKAYDGMDIEEFDSFGPVNKTLEQFAYGYDDLIRIIRSFMIKY